MSDFPSINSLLGNSSSKEPGDTGAKKSAKAPAAANQNASQKFSNKMRDIDIKEKEKLTAQKAANAGLPYIDLSNFPVSAEALKTITEEEAGALGAVCFYFSTEEMRVGLLELTDEAKAFLESLVERYHANVLPYLISQHSLERVLKLYGNLPIIRPVSKDIVITDEEIAQFEGVIDNLTSLEEQFSNVSITNILTLMVAAALKLNASDIHVEAEDKGIAVRYRIDGVLHDAAKLPKEQWKRFISRIKLLAALKINVTDRPQDGRVTLRLSKESLDVRVSTMPTIYGESVVMRVLFSGSKGVTYEELGLRGEAFDKLRKEVERPNGMIITTGPTGSGKTTTLYAILRTLNKPGVKIITLEDPIEIKMDGINQSQVDPSHDYTFAKGLRSILRQDPDICMVGEIRDLETAEISIQAALTGHLMLSTIHTNSAAGAIPRFMSMGVKPFLLAPALNSIIGQRLVRRICPDCSDIYTPSADEMERVNKTLSALPASEKSSVHFDDLRFYKGKGCAKCSNLGYKGRIGIYEIFVMNKEVEQIILSSAVSEYTIQELAIKNGMVTMVQDGLLKALEGITTLEEVFRVVE